MDAGVMPRYDSLQWLFVVIWCSCAVVSLHSLIRLLRVRTHAQAERALRWLRARTGTLHWTLLLSAHVAPTGFFWVINYRLAGAVVVLNLTLMLLNTWVLRKYHLQRFYHILAAAVAEDFRQGRY